MTAVTKTQLLSSSQLSSLGQSIEYRKAEISRYVQGRGGAAGVGRGPAAVDGEIVELGAERTGAGRVGRAGEISGVLLRVSGVVEVEELSELDRGSFQAGSIVVVVVVVRRRRRERPVVAGRAAAGRRLRPSVHRQLLDRARALLLLRGHGCGAELVQGVDEVAARAVRAEADRVVGAAQVGLVLRVPIDVAQFVVTVGELTLLAVLAAAVLLVGSAQLGLVAGRGLGLGLGRQRGGRGLGGGLLGGRGGALSGDEGAAEAHLAIPEEAAQGFSGWGDGGAGGPSGGEMMMMMMGAGAQGLVVAIDTNPEALETVQLDLSNHCVLDIV